MKNDLVSVIIPVYNRQAYIEECVASVLAQSHHQLQILLIDDGSTDETPQICRRLAEKHPQIQLLLGSHAGVSAARNQGLDAAQGEYVFFIDSDDVIHPELIRTLVEAMEETGAAMGGTPVMNVAYFHWDRVDPYIAADQAPGETVFHDHESALREMFYNNAPINTVGGTILRRSLVGNTRFRTDLTIGEDFYFSYENLVKGASAVFVKQKRYFCRIHKHNSSNCFGFDGFWARFYRRKLVWEREAEQGRTCYSDNQKRNAYYVYLRFISDRRTTKADRKKICAVMRDNLKQMLPAMSFRGKLACVTFTYLPYLYPLLFRPKQDDSGIW